MENKSNDKCFHEYPKKELIVADILMLLDGHDVVIIMDDDYSSEIKGPIRVEDLTCDPDTCCASYLCDEVVRSMDISSDGTLMISIEKDIPYDIKQKEGE